MFTRLAILCVLAASLLCAKSFKVNIQEPARLGNVEVAPGDYKLEVEGDSAVLTDKAGKEIAKATKIETMAVKSVRTVLSASKDGDKLRISAIKPAGTTQKVLFE